MIITEDDCGRVRLVSVNGTSEETAYSQDLNKYFWREICYDQNEAGVCVGGYFIDLVVKTDRRIITEDGDSVDLTSVPWASIAADLKTVFGRDFKDPELRFEEIGKGCIF
ncbi:uncharacterized protein LOC123550177 [Mercenaria mercenaria]|uniref:uncharacterized protein LOC123550177 n=1 Tax=Mercenaria mercenaria TaxID=6596 RepID=UPI00234ED463|nr:uncharacterized protein LOC123550177 [Mercenaria mercenaria]